MSLSYCCFILHHVHHNHHKRLPPIVLSCTLHSQNHDILTHGTGSFIQFHFKLSILVSPVSYVPFLSSDTHVVSQVFITPTRSNFHSLSFYIHPSAYQHHYPLIHTTKLQFSRMIIVFFLALLSFSAVPVGSRPCNTRVAPSRTHAAFAPF